MGSEAVVATSERGADQRKAEGGAEEVVQRRTDENADVMGPKRTAAHVFDAVGELFLAVAPILDDPT